MSRSFSFAVLSVIALVCSAHIQAEDIRADVPFAFKAGQAVLPAGKYEIRFDGVETPGVLLVRSEDGREHAFVAVWNADASRGSEEARLIFDKEDGGYVLTEVVSPGADHGLQVVGTHLAPEGERVVRPAAAD